jgi:hypothetical protein
MALRRVTYLSVLQLASTSFSGDPNPDSDDSASLNKFIRKWAREAWEKYFWPELTPIEKRQFRDDWSSATTYGAPTATAAVEVYYPKTQKYYQSLRGSNTNNAPATGAALTENSAWWAESDASYSGNDWAASTVYAVGNRVLNTTDQRYYQCHTAHTSGASFDSTKFGVLTPFVRSIDYEQTGKTPVGEVKQVWDQDPKVFETADPIPFDLTDTIVVRGSETIVYLEFRKRAPDYSGSTYSATATYAVNDQIYFTDGDFYKCLTATIAGESPTSAAAKWERLDFPLILKEAVAQGAYADMLKEDGQTEKAAIEKAETTRLINREIDKIERQQSQAGQLNVLTR